MKRPRGVDGPAALLCPNERRQSREELSMQQEPSVAHRKSTRTRRLSATLLLAVALVLGISQAPLLGPPAVVKAAECAGDECQGAPSVPDDPTPGTSVF